MSSTGASPPGDQAKVSISLALDPMQAFEAFTQDIDVRWACGGPIRCAP